MKNFNENYRNSDDNILKIKDIGIHLLTDENDNFKDYWIFFDFHFIIIFFLKLYKYFYIYIFEYFFFLNNYNIFHLIISEKKIK